MAEAHPKQRNQMPVGEAAEVAEVAEKERAVEQQLTEM